ncbi:MAG: DUF1570 domain-containing protein [Planctomycetes bacterium]|nr:DUF1570 domain-containing protein [Planctomycetota bacterium]
MRILAFALLSSVALADAAYEDRRAGVTFSAPDGWIEVPTPPVPEDVEEDADGPTPVVRYQASEPDGDGMLARIDVFLLRAGTADEAAKELEGWASETWRGFEVLERNELGSGRTLNARIDGGKAFAAIMASGSRHAAIFLAGGPSQTDAPIIRATGTWLFLDPDPAAPLRIPPGWKASETQHYRLRFQGDDDFAREVGRHLEAISAELRRILPLEVPGGDRRSLDVRLFSNAREFAAYASANGVEGAEAYFSPAQNELVAHMDERSPDRTFHVLYHEATHQYLRDVLGRKTRIPIWLDEGLGEVFYGGAFGAGGAFTVGPNDARLDEARRALKSGAALKLDTMFGMSRDEFYDVDSAYGQGLSVAWFLLSDPRYRGVVPAWLAALRDEGDAKKAQAKALENHTVEQLERDWKRWLVEE